MIKVENIDIWGFEHAIRGMRNPMNSWEKSDSIFADQEHQNYHDILGEVKDCSDSCPIFLVGVGKNDLDLMKRLFDASKDGNHAHRKYLRQIFVSMDITAPLYWWKEFDTYKIGTVANSCSTMHKIAEKEFTLEDFSCEHLETWLTLRERHQDNAIETSKCEPVVNIGDDYSYSPAGIFALIIEMLNRCRYCYLKTKDKRYWWFMIQLLPTSYNQKRTVTMNYENVVTIIQQRTGHKLDEWNNFVDILKELPYVEAITEGD